ncbi:secretory phospholipase A2 receptor-like [Hydra vulgaris]|uniref:Secretory phospholipase A2 receptor-like n=1 Tax=Hydra vulgaris TaxID=6087 RepID=A0ABM4B3V2_HYDVU
MKPQSTCLIFNCVLSFFVLSVRTEIYPCESEEWKYFDYSCYWSSLYNQNPLIHQTNWFNAARECRKRNSNLVSIRNQRENQMIFTLNRCANAWIGLVMIDNNLTMSESGWEWFDNSKRNYTNWKLNKSHGDKFECSYLHNGDGKWANNLHCGDYLNYYVCKKQLKFDTFLNIPTDFDTYFNMSTDFDTYFKMPTDFEIFRGLCGNGWVLLGEKCYYVSLSKVDYFEAMIQCQSKQGHLVSIHSSKENTDLIRVFNSCETLWIGIENIDPSKVSEIVGWKWSDGTLVNYHNWKDGGIENDQTKQCGTLQSGAKWINVSCWELHLFVCEKPKPK